MFLADLNEPQKHAFLTLALRITQADGEDAVEEREALDALCVEMDIENEIEMSKVLGKIDIGRFDTKRVRVIAALELMLLVHADDYMHEAEVAEVTRICEAMGFGKEWIALMAEWARRISWTDDDPNDGARNGYRAELVEYANRIME